ncbi:hypothetical protein HPP92_003761 [Vanilla planifolia]|uniref:Alpha-carbonic anhydrase domain-containing protein n=1 Tax=Vanilla planifolia TaxID=51239 RepID=A0A835RV15_VANPL|nr:hypothetical protein HPP92_003761 [Vanilla planifolia]
MASPELLLALGFATLLASNAIAHTGQIWFGYKGNAPANWGKLSPDYKTCSIGTHQSPINIAKDDVSLQNKLHDLHRQYVDANATVVNNGFNIMVRFIQNAGYMSQDGKHYRLEQLHWHTPSEHTFNMKRFPLEIHLVHKSDDDKIIVVAILYEYGNIDPFIYQLKDAIIELAEKNNSNVSVGLVKTKSFRRHTRKFFKYIGSLTTPPCTENVTWYILGKAWCDGPMVRLN